MREKTISSEPLWVLFLWELLVLILFLVSKIPTAGDTLILISHITIYHTVSLERHPRKLWCWKFNFLMCLCLSMVEGPCTYSLFWWIDITSNDDCYWGKLGYDYIICSYIFIAQVFFYHHLPANRRSLFVRTWCVLTFYRSGRGLAGRT